MLNYLKAELWRYFRRPAGRLLFLLAVSLPVLLSFYIFLGVYFVNLSDLYYQTLSLVVVLMPFSGIFFLCGIVDASFADEYRLSTLKNNLSAGISRGTVYAGKLMGGLILALLHLVVAIAAFLLSAVPLLSLDLTELALPVGLMALEVLPLWLGMMGILQLCYFTFHSGFTAVAAVSIVGLLLLSVLGSLNFPVTEILVRLSLLEWLVRVMTNPMSWELAAECWGIGGFYFTVCTAAGWMLFRRREIR